MKVRFKLPWRNYRPGQEIEAADGMANVWIARGIVEEVKPHIETKPTHKRKR